MKKIITLALLPFAAAILGCILFFVVSLIPQNAIQYNASQAAKELTSQDQWPMVLNTGDRTYKMDNYTDSQIIMQSYNLTSENLSSILTNPKHKSEQVPNNMALALDEVVNRGAENEMSYCRYWMGFRIYVRPLLIACSYYDIRKLIAAIFFTLLFSAIIVISKKVNVKTALCFGLAIIPFNPAIISQSLQFSCTFLLMFLFVMYVCLSIKNPLKNILVTFCAFGVLTQFFDFYTTPLVTYGFPILIMLSMNTIVTNKLLTLVKTFFAWLYGYVAMWIVKLLFTTLFTDVNGFADGFYRFAERTGIVIQEGWEKYYDVAGAFKAVLNTVLPGGLKIFLFPFLIMICVSLGVIFFKRKFKCALNDIAPFVVATLPLVWYACSAQPTYIHAWFQYRTLSVTVFGVFLMVAYAISLFRERLLLKKLLRVKETEKKMDESESVVI